MLSSFAFILSAKHQIPSDKNDERERKCFAHLQSAYITPVLSDLVWNLTILSSFQVIGAACAINGNFIFIRNYAMIWRLFKEKVKLLCEADLLFEWSWQNTEFAKFSNIKPNFFSSSYQSSFVQCVHCSRCAFLPR